MGQGRVQGQCCFLSSGFFGGGMGGFRKLDTITPVSWTSEPDCSSPENPMNHGSKYLLELVTWNFKFLKLTTSICLGVSWNAALLLQTFDVSSSHWIKYNKDNIIFKVLTLFQLGLFSSLIRSLISTEAVNQSHGSTTQCWIQITNLLIKVKLPCKMKIAKQTANMTSLE